MAKPAASDRFGSVARIISPTAIRFQIELAYVQQLVKPSPPGPLCASALEEAFSPWQGSKKPRVCIDGVSATNL